MKKYRISFVLMFQILLLSLGVGVLSFCLSNDVSSAAASDQAVASSTELKSTKPENLSELQSATEAQLEAWAGLNKFDGREYDYVTPQKSQSGETCWAYAATGLAEVSVLRQGLAPEGKTYKTLDFDDLYVAWASKNMDKSNNPLNLMNDDVFSAGVEWSGGGWLCDALYSMTDGFSPIDQQPEDQFKQTKQSRYIAEQVIHIDPKPDAIKKAILKYGGVGFSYAPSGSEQGYFYWPYSETTHVSVIVGWDDSIDKSKFSCTSNQHGPQKAKKDGAWIVKNSWGENHGADTVHGIYAYYMSYESYISECFVVDMGLKEDHPNIYQYDGGSVDSNSGFSDIKKNAAIYEAKLSDPTKQEYLKAIQVGFKAQDVDLQIEIYKLDNVNPANVNDKINDPTKGTQIYQDSVKFAKDGFYIIPLKQEILLEQGEYFSIVLYDATYKDLKIFCAVDVNSVNDMTYFYQNEKWQSHKDGEAYIYANQANNKRTARIRAITYTKNRETPLDGHDLQYARIEIDKGLFYYQKGKQQEPTITVSIGDKPLTKNNDYKVEIEKDNIKPGTVKVKITGMGDYKGSRETMFEIAKPYLPDDLPDKSMTVYNNVTTLSDIHLPEGWEWLYGDREQVPVGKRTFTIKYIADDHVCYINNLFDIEITKLNQEPPERKSIRGASIVVNGRYSYTGSAIIPDLTVTLDNISLKKDTDYTLKCSDNINAGTATVTITGIGLYKGSLNQNFEISKADHPANQPDGTKSVSRRITKLSEIQLPTDWIWKDSSLTITKDVFTATAEYTGSDKQNYTNTEVEITVTRAAKVDISTINVTCQQGNFVYDNGNPIEPAVVATDGGYTLLLNSDFNVAYQSNTNAGQGTIVITGIGEYYTGTKIVKFEILKAEKPDAETTIKVNNQIQELSDINPPESFEWIEGSLEVVSENRMTARARYIGEDAENYTNTEVTFEIIIDNATEKQEKSKKDANILWWGLGIGGGISVIGIVGWLISRRKKI